MKQIKYHWNLIGVTLPYNIEGGQIQDTNGTSEWFTVKFNYSSGQQWVIFILKAELFYLRLDSEW